MKILVVCQYYYPEPFRISDICEELKQAGNEVTVITGVPNYPMGKIYPEYRFGKKRHEEIAGVKVHRCFTVGRRKGAIWRFINYYSFAISSSLFVARMKDDYDVVLVNQLSPVMMAAAALKYKKKAGKRILLYCLDLWPASLTAGGINRDSIVYKLFFGVSKKIYNAADKILVSSKAFGGQLKKDFGISEEKTAYLPQYAEDLFSPEKCRKNPDEYLDLLFAGNVGSAQSMDTIIKAASATPENIRWHIVGDGSELERCMALAEELETNNVIFHGRRPLSEMPGYYASADAMLISLYNDEIISLTLPGKIQSYLSAGKPVIAAASGEIKRVIEEAECGICCPPEDSEALAAAALKMLDEKLREEYSANAVKYNSEHFSKQRFISRIISELEDLGGAL